MALCVVNFAVLTVRIFLFVWQSKSFVQFLLQLHITAYHCYSPVTFQPEAEAAHISTPEFSE